MKRTRGVDNPRAQELCLTPNTREDIKSCCFLFFYHRYFFTFLIIHGFLVTTWAESVSWVIHDARLELTLTYHACLINFEIWDFEQISIFSRIFRFFFSDFFRHFFSKKNRSRNVFSELRKKIGYRFDVKNLFFRFMRFPGPSEPGKRVF